MGYVILILVIIIIVLGVIMYLGWFSKTDAILKNENRDLIFDNEVKEKQIEAAVEWVQKADKKVAANKAHKYKTVAEITDDETMPAWMRK